MGFPMATFLFCRVECVLYMKKEFDHAELGTVRVSVNNRTQRIVMRVRDGAVCITVPPNATKADIERALANHGDRLRRMLAENVRSVGPQYTAGCGKFRIAVQEYRGANFMWVHDAERLILMCPENTDYAEKQEWLRKAVVNVVTDEAKRVLPSRLEVLAGKHGLQYSRCTVRDSHSRWGSCSSKGSISLSIYLVLLPDELIDYIILHELCHTVEMNHGERFWAMLDGFCDGKSRELRRVLKKHFPGI